MRFLLIFLTACTTYAADAAYGGGGDDGNGSASLSECNVDGDCAAGAAKCCDCPTYAAPKTDSTIIGCSGVMCPQMDCPANVAPACNNHQCVLECKAMACANSCPNGFAVDANGCLSCDCAMPTETECMADTDCSETAADCCGCARGGADTSVPTSELAAYQAGLGCSPTPFCPGSNTCVAEDAPFCVQGGCALLPPLPALACGRDDLPACTGGTTCTVNLPSPNSANDHRVGQCLP